jgi:hypothetical protein
MITAQDVRAVALSLPRTEEHLIRDRVKFRVGKIVYVAISSDETTMGFGFPREERAAMIAAEPGRFFLERLSDQRFNWIDVRMALVSPAEMREFVTDAWRMVVPRRVAAAHAAAELGVHVHRHSCDQRLRIAVGLVGIPTAGHVIGVAAGVVEQRGLVCAQPLRCSV